jgi:hypothetical protein
VSSEVTEQKSNGRSNTQTPRPTFVPTAVRYIKLGQGGQWADEALDRGIIPFGYPKIEHPVCMKGDWAQVRQQLSKMGRKPGAVSNGLRELREFYELPNDTLWVTCARGHFWWAFAEGGVVEIKHPLPDSPIRYRPTRTGWSNKDLSGGPLTVRSLSSALTSTTNYQMTICAVKQANYLLARIRGDVDPLCTKAATLIKDQRDLASQMVCRLDWRDFETLIDLIFARGGWQRQSAVGGNQADVDMVLTQPTTNETAWVQVKSRSSQGELDDYLRRFHNDGSFNRFFFICHSAPRVLRMPDAANLKLWMAEQIADAALEAGLFRWLVDRLR